MENRTTFIVSYPRSGNTWVRLLLEHSLGFVTEALQPVGREFLSELTGGDRHITQLPSVHVIKTHAFALSGNDPVIYVLRDGRDATVSYWHYMSSYGNREKGQFSRFLRDLYSTRDWWPDHVHHWLNVDSDHPKIVVRFEDLHQNQERELGRMLGFLGIEPVRPFKDFERALQFRKLNEYSPDFFRSGRVGEWMEQFSDEDTRFFLEYGWGMLEQFGYAVTKGERSHDSQQAILTQRDGWIQRYVELDRQVRKKQAEIELLSREADLRLREIEKIAAQLREKESEISNLSRAADVRLRGMEEKEKLISELSQVAKDRLRAVAEKEKEIQRLTALSRQDRKGTS